MDKLDEFQRRIKELNRLVSEWKQSKHKIIGFVEHYKLILNQKEINELEFNTIVDSKLKNKSFDFGIENNKDKKIELKITEELEFDVQILCVGYDRRMFFKAEGYYIENNLSWSLF